MVEKIIELYLSGMSDVKVSQALGIKRGIVHKALRDNDIPLRTRKGRNSDRDQKILDMYKKGLSSVFIAEHLGVSVSTVTWSLNVSGVNMRNNKDNSRKYTCNENFFELIDTEEKSYWLGFIYADGMVCARSKNNASALVVSISSEDRVHLEKMKRSLLANNPIQDYLTSGNAYKFGTPYSRLSIRSDKIFEDLCKLGVITNKTEVLTFPDDSKVPRHLISHFIRGYIDGDGSYAKTGNSNYYVIKICGTLEFLTGTKEILGLSHLALQKRWKNRDSNVYSLEIGGRLQAKRITKWLYDGATTYLDRKYERASVYLDTPNENIVPPSSNARLESL